jgi:hypothetical protein
MTEIFRQWDIETMKHLKQWDFETVRHWDSETMRQWYGKMLDVETETQMERKWDGETERKIRYGEMYRDGYIQII